MAVNIGPKIGIDGEAEYRKELKSIIQETKTLAAETNEAAAAFKNADDKEKAAKDVTEKLNKQIEAQRKLVEKLEEGVKKSAEATGENSDETLKWKEQLAKAKAGLNTLEAQTKETTGEVQDLGEAEADTSDKTSVFGDVLKANLASDLIKKGLQMTLDLVKDIGEMFVEAVKGAAEYADEISTLEKTTGLSTDALQEYKYMANLLDVDLETITGSMTKMEKAMSSDAKAFDYLGVATRDENGNLRDANDVFEDTLAALKKIENPVERDTKAMEIFGKSAKDLNPLIETSADDLDALRKEAHKVGAVIDKDTLSALNDVNDSMDRMGLTWDSIKKTLGAKIGIKVLPEIENLTKSFQKLAETGDLEGFVKDVSAQLGKLVQKLPEYVRKIAKELPKALKALATSDLWSDLASSIGDTLAAIFENLPSLLDAGGALIGEIIKGAVMIIPNMITRLINGFDDGLDGLDEVTNEHVEAVRKKIEEIPDVMEDVQKRLDEVNGKQREAEHWIDIFDELSKKTDPTSEDTERLQEAVERLNELFPELGLKIEEDTGKWNLNSQEIRENIQALADRAKADAYNDAASKRYAEIVELERERESLKNELAEIKSKITEKTASTDLLKGQIAAVEELNKKLRDGDITVDEYKKKWKELGIAFAPQIGTTTVMGETVDLLDSNLVNLNTSLRNAEYTIGELEKQKVPLEKGIGEVDTAINGLNDEITYFYTKASDLANPVVTSLDAAGDDVEKAGERTGKRYNGGVVKGIKDGPSVYEEGVKTGRQLDNGVKKGIDDNSGIVSSAARSVITKAISSMKATAQIKSPSKVTENLIGKNLALGVVKGWDDVMDPSKLSKEFSLTPAFDAMTSSVTNTTNNTTNLGGVSVNVYAREGMNIDELTDAIMIKMQRAVNGRKAVFSNEFHI